VRVRPKSKPQRSRMFGAKDADVCPQLENRRRRAGELRARRRFSLPPDAEISRFGRERTMISRRDRSCGVTLKLGQPLERALECSNRALPSVLQTAKRFAVIEKLFRYCRDRKPGFVGVIFGTRNECWDIHHTTLIGLFPNFCQGVYPKCE